MAHLHEFTDVVVQRLAEHGLLAHGWDPPLASDWLAAELNPLGWVLLVKDSGWAQSLYEQHVTAIVQDVLVDPAARRPARDRSN